MLFTRQKVCNSFTFDFFSNTCMEQEFIFFIYIFWYCFVCLNHSFKVEEVPVIIHIWSKTSTLDLFEHLKFIPQYRCFISASNKKIKFIFIKYNSNIIKKSTKKRQYTFFLKQTWPWRNIQDFSVRKIAIICQDSSIIFLSIFDDSRM